MRRKTAWSLASTNLIHLDAWVGVSPFPFFESRGCYNSEEPGPGGVTSCEQFGGFMKNQSASTTLFDLKHPYPLNFQGIKCINIMESLTESLFGYQNRALFGFSFRKPLFPPCTLDARKWPFSLSSTVKVTYIRSGWYRWVFSSSGVDADKNRHLRYFKRIQEGHYKK